MKKQITITDKAMETTRAIKGIERVEVTSMAEAYKLGYKYLICWRNHYRGNAKGEIMKVVEGKDVTISHNNYEDRGICAIYATNEDIPVLIERRKRIIRLIQDIEFNQSVNSKLYDGLVNEYHGCKMVFGNWRHIYKQVKKEGCKNIKREEFFKRHHRILSILKLELEKTNGISSTMSISQQ